MHPWPRAGKDLGVVLLWKDVTIRRLMAVRGGARDFRARPLCATHATYIIFLSKNISISGFDQSQTILILTIDRVKITIIICKSLYSYFLFYEIS